MIADLQAAIDGQRLDVFLAENLPGTTRIAAGALVRGGHVTVVGKPLIKPSTWLAAGDRVQVALPEPEAAEAIPQDLPLPILYADDHLVVVHKPAGMATHPGPGWWQGSAVNALLHHVRPWRPIGGVATPGIVHRLDRDTEGLLAFANGADAQQVLLADIAQRRIARRYLAVVHGRLAGEGLIDLPLGRDPRRPDRVHVREDGKPARTRWRALGADGTRTLLRLELETGRNHQIRAHLAHLDHPVVGDPWYGREGDEGPLRLCAYQLGLAHPIHGGRLDFAVAPAWPEIGLLKSL
jgi:23S rRNA pseudouridine1911/1915/1917 synthase